MGGVGSVAALRTLVDYLVIPLLARGAMPYIFWRLDYASSSGLGSALVDRLSRQRILVSLLFVAVALSFAAPLEISVLFVVVSLLIYFWWRRASYQKLGGFNGDCAGALVEFLELGLLLGLATYTGSSL